MRIDEIRLTGYRQYRKAVLRLPQGHPGDLHLVVGRNGLGKTNLMNAIEWCLYGTESHLSGKDQDGLLDISHQAPRGVAANDKTSVCVDVTFVGADAQTCRGTFERVRSDPGGQHPKTHFSFTTLTAAGSRTYENDDAKVWVERFIPEGMKDNYLFDGEHLAGFFKSSDPGHLRNALWKLSGVALLGLVEEHLGELARDLQKKVGAKIPDMKVLTDQVEDDKNMLRQERLDLQTAIKDKQIATDALDAIAQKLRDAPPAAELQDKQVDLEKKRTGLIQRQSQERAERNVVVCRLFVVAALLQNLIDFQTRLVDMEERHEIPPPIDASVLKRILEKDLVCICDTKLRKGDEHFKALSELLERVREKSEFQEVLPPPLRSEVPALLRAAEEQKVALFKSRRTIAEISSEQQEVEKQLDTIHNTLLGHNVQEIANLERQRVQMQQRMVSADRDEERHNGRIEVLENGLDELSKQIETAAKKGKETQEISRRMGIVNRAMDVIKDGKAERELEVRGAVARDMEESFRELMWKKDSFDEATLDSNYVVHVRDDLGHEALGSLSTAETQVAAIAFTLALHRVSGYEGPMVIDTPFALTEGELRKHMAETLASLSRTKQVLLMLKDTEMTAEVELAFAQVTASQWVLNNGEYEKETVIKESVS